MVRHFYDDPMTEVSINTDFPEILINGKELVLTPMQFRIFKFLWDNLGKTCSRNIILNHVYNWNPEIETRAVDVHIGYIRKRIEEQDIEGVEIKTIRGFGYKLKYI